MAKPLVPDELWAVERTHAQLNRLHRMSVRHDRRADTFLAFSALGCVLV